MFVWNVYGIMRCDLCLIFIASRCNETVLLVHQCVITNGPLYGVSWLYSALLTKHDFISNFLVVVKTFTIFADIIFLLICVLFCWCISSQYTVCVIRIIISWPNTIFPYYNLLTYLLFSKFWTLPPLRCMTMIHPCLHIFN